MTFLILEYHSQHTKQLKKYLSSIVYSFIAKQTEEINKMSKYIIITRAD